MNGLSRAFAAAAAAVLTSCVVVEPPPPPPPPPPQALPEPVVEAPPPVKEEPEPAPVVKAPDPQLLRLNELEGLFSEFERLRRLAPAELAREQENARQAFNQLRTDAARLRYAMALTVPGTAGAEGPALELLEPLIKNAAAPLHGLAFLLAAYIQEQRRLVSQVQGLQQNMQGLQQNVQALQQKLDALRTLERALTERESGPPRRR